MLPDSRMANGHSEGEKKNIEALGINAVNSM